MSAAAAMKRMALLACALAAAPAGACVLEYGKMSNPRWIGSRGDQSPASEIEIVGFVRGVEAGETRMGDRLIGRPPVVRIETIRAVKGERRPEWRVALVAPVIAGGPPDIGEGPYRFHFDLPETIARESAPVPLRETRLPGSDAVLPSVGMRLCGFAAIFPVFPYAPDVLLARAVGASAAPFVAGLSGLALFAGAAALLRRRWRRA